MDPILAALASSVGIHFMGVNAGFQKPNVAHNFGIAQDAQPELITTSNAGIPAYLSTYIDPKIIEVLVAPMKAAEIAGEEVKKGDWVTDTAAFPMIENTGETSAYGDYNNNGSVGANFDFPQRQSFHYQTITQWGEKELAKANLARIDYANRLNIASILVLNKYQNKTYFFGVKGLQNYGLLNDPHLPAPIAPTSQNGMTTWAQKDGAGVYADIPALFAQLQAQSNGLVDLNTPMTLAMSPGSEVMFTKTNQYNVNVSDQLRKNFPNLKVKTAPEYATSAGNLVQLIVDEMEGQRTVEVAFTEKLRAHPIVTELSSFKQKKSQGTWGAIIYRPFLVAQMLGV